MRLSHAGTFVGGVVLAIALMVLLGAGGAVKSPTGVAPDRYVYYQENGVTIRSWPAIHEAFLTPEQLVTLYNQAPQTAIGVGTIVHTPPQAFGKVMSTIKPRHAIAYHFFNESDTRDEIYAMIRETYDGPLTLAEDNLVWNITKQDIQVRSIVSTEDAWSQIGPNQPPPPDHTVPSQLSKEMMAGRWDISEVTAEMIKEFKAKHGLE